MRYMLDTNICIDLMRGRAAGLFAKLRKLTAGRVGISSITLAELQYGALKSQRSAHHQSLIVMFCAPLEMAPFDSPAAEVYGSIRARLESDGQPIGPLDTLIAAHALSLQAVLVTDNVREFRRVPDLALADSSSFPHSAGKQKPSSQG